MKINKDILLVIDKFDVLRHHSELNRQLFNFAGHMKIPFM